MIRRPMLYAACGCAGAVIVSYYAGCIIAACAAFACWTISYLLGISRGTGRRRIIARILFFFYLAGAVSFVYTDSTMDARAERLEAVWAAAHSGGGKAVLSGEIITKQTSISETGDVCVQLTVRTDAGRVLARCYASCTGREKASEGCKVRMTGKLQDPSPRRNPNCFDYTLYLRTLGITKTVTCSSLEVDPVRSFQEAPLSFLRNRVSQVREGFIGRLEAETDRRTASLIRAILFGDKGSLDEDLLESFQKNGTAHILAVSGLHIGIIYGFILRLWRARRGWLFFSFNAVFFFLYAMAAGFSPSVTRAVIMVLLHIVALICGRRYDLSNAALLIALVIILRNPYMLLNTGFEMSFLAVLSIALITPYVKRIYAGVFTMSLVVQAGLGPFILYSFNYLPLLAVLVNVPVAAVTGLIVPAALLCMCLGHAEVFTPMFAVIKPMCSVLISLNEATRIDGVTSFQIPSPPVWAVAAVYLLFLLLASEEGRLALIRSAKKGRHLLSVLLITVILSAGFGAFASDGFRNCDVTFVDVGQGDCTCIRAEAGLLKNDRYYLFDGGGNVNYNVGKKVLRQYLLKNGIARVDAFATHLHTDHYKGICELAREGMVEHLYVYDANRLRKTQIMEETGLSAGQISFLAAGDSIRLSGGSGLFDAILNDNSVNLEILHPERKNPAEYERLLSDETDENSLSLLFKVTFSGKNGSTSVLITGDLGEEGEQELLREHRAAGTTLRADILKVGHHGSKTSSTEEFLDAVSPKLAVIQVGENNMYGHPSEEAMERIAASGAAIYRNDLQGAVGFAIHRGRIVRTRTMIREFHAL